MNERNDLTTIRAFARRYADAWCGHDPTQVAACYTPQGSLTINDGTAAVGRAAIAEVVRGFMHDFPDMRVTLDQVSTHDCEIIFHWTLTGTNTGPGGSGKGVCISGHEVWRLSPEGLIAESCGHFDQAEYERQLRREAGKPAKL